MPVVVTTRMAQCLNKIKLLFMLHKCCISKEAEHQLCFIVDALELWLMETTAASRSQARMGRGNLATGPQALAAS